MPRVSIGLPVYNGENFVEQAVASVLAQTYEDWELIISDNGSSDGTAELCARFAAVDSRIRLEQAPQNRGAAWNFNRVFELSTGEYFRWLSHDDVLAPQALERCVQVLERRPDVLLCHTNTGTIDAQGFQIFDQSDELEKSASEDQYNRLEYSCDLAFQGLTIEGERRRIAQSQSDSPHRRFAAILFDSLRCYEVYGLVRREIMATTQLHPSYCGGEKVLLAELALLGKFHELPETLFYCRWHDERFTANPSAEQQNEHMQPGVKRHWTLPHQYRATLGYLQLVLTKPMPLAQRWRCLTTWLRFCFQLRKWASILSNTVTGRATHATLDRPTRRGGRIHFDTELAGIRPQRPSLSASDPAEVV